jgi:nucleolin
MSSSDGDPDEPINQIDDVERLTYDKTGACTLYVTNINFNLTEDVFRRRFSEFVAIHSVYIPMKKGRRQSKGFGFVEFEQQADAKRAMDALNDEDWDGRRLWIQFSHSEGNHRHGEFAGRGHDPRDRDRGGSRYQDDNRPRSYRDDDSRSRSYRHDDRGRGYRDDERSRSSRDDRPGRSRDRDDRYDS